MSKSRTITLKKNDEATGECVVYVMSRDQRTSDNFALLEAQRDAEAAKLPLIVLFVLYEKSGVRSREHYEFMLDGLRDVKKSCTEKNIPFILRAGEKDSAKTIIDFLAEVSAKSVYFDFSPLRGPRKLQKAVSKQFDGASFVVDTHNIIPAWIVSDKQEFAAHTLRRKIHKQLEPWLELPAKLKKHPYDFHGTRHSLSFEDAEKCVAKRPKNNTSTEVKSGETAARAVLKEFVDERIKHYAMGRNDIARNEQSRLSPYLHFGQLSSLRVVLDVMDNVSEPPLLLRQAKMAQAGENPSKTDGMNALFEELIVRKELSDNYCFYNANYDTVSGAPDWGKKELDQHSSDAREFVYTKKQFENAKTHDDLWNASQLQLRKVGNIHGYMRMYWAKKIFEWSNTPSSAVKTAIYLNDHYSIDGGDPNGYVGILWSMAGLHDRPWFDRDIYGKIRYMSASGIEKKFDTEAYIDAWASDTNIKK